MQTRNLPARLAWIAGIALAIGRAIGGLVGLWTGYKLAGGAIVLALVGIGSWFAVESGWPLKWGAYPLIGAAFALAMSLAFFFSVTAFARIGGLRGRAPAPQTVTSAAPALDQTPPLAVRLVAINWDHGYIQPNRAAPAIVFMCHAFNGLPTAIRLMGAEGRVAVRGQELHDQFELRQDNDHPIPHLGHPIERYLFFRFMLALRLGDRAADYVRTTLATASSGRVSLEFRGVRVVAQTNGGQVFSIAIPDRIKFNAQTGQASPMIVGY
jgi:hypothetical protein